MPKINKNERSSMQFKIDFLASMNLVQELEIDLIV